MMPSAMGSFSFRSQQSDVGISQEGNRDGSPNYHSRHQLQASILTHNSSGCKQQRHQIYRCSENQSCRSTIVTRRRWMFPMLLVLCMALFSCKTIIITKKASDNDGTWHALFQHSHRTADIEIGGSRIKSVSMMPNGDRKLNSMTSFYGSLSSDLRVGKNTTEDQCNATHSLLSPSSILRSSYGNIFSITTPDGDTNTSETITIKTLSLRMSDFQPDEGNHFEVWLFTGSGDNAVLNENDLDDDPTNDNIIVPSKANYQQSRGNFTDWQLISGGNETELVPDTDFYDHNGHGVNLGGRLAGYESVEEITIAAKQWNAGKLREDGAMDAITAEGKIIQTFFFKIPEDKFTSLKLPKSNGKLTLFITLDRVGMQYGFANKEEFDQVDVQTQDYTDQAPSLNSSISNDSINLQMNVGEGVIFYPWMEEKFFYPTRRFLGKIWYEAEVPCEYPITTEPTSSQPNSQSSTGPDTSTEYPTTNSPTSRPTPHPNDNDQPPSIAKSSKAKSAKRPNSTKSSKSQFSNSGKTASTNTSQSSKSSKSQEVFAKSGKTTSINTSQSSKSSKSQEVFAKSGKTTSINTSQSSKSSKSQEVFAKSSKNGKSYTKKQTSINTPRIPNSEVSYITNKDSKYSKLEFSSEEEGRSSRSTSNRLRSSCTILAITTLAVCLLYH